MLPIVGKRSTLTAERKSWLAHTPAPPRLNCVILGERYPRNGSLYCCMWRGFQLSYITVKPAKLRVVPETPSSPIHYSRIWD